MAEGSRSAEQIRSFEETSVPAEVLIFQPMSDDEESSEDEYFETSERFQELAAGPSGLQNLEERSSPGVSTEVGTVVSSETAENAPSAKCYDALDYFSKDTHSSSEGSKSVGSSTGSSYMYEYRAGEAENSNYVSVDVVDAIKDSDFVKLMLKCRVDHYLSVFSKADLMLIKCKRLFERDYECKEIDNSGGSLCKHYPERIIVPIAEKSVAAGSERVGGIELDMDLYIDQIKASVSSRLRKRFVVPAIMFDKKYICRAGTITVRKTAVYETTNKSPPPRAQRIDESPIKQAARNIARAFIEASNRGKEAAIQLFIPSSIRKLRDTDAEILRTLKVLYICDLMIEDRKKFKHIRLSSSEKINPDIYRDCNIEQMPYPGCQFFRRYHEADRVPEGLIFNWNRSDVNTDVKLTEYPNLIFPDIEWENYKEWDVVVLTKNYMKVLLSYMARGTVGLLVHCVSGWDRTPLFISILRISLWADGVVHGSLNYKEMAYLTLAYDWYLFGHNLPSRLHKKEEIMHFCFKFLPYIVSDEFSITRMYHELPIEERGDASLPDFTPGRRSVLNEISSCLLNIYDEFLTGMLG